MEILYAAKMFLRNFSVSFSAACHKTDKSTPLHPSAMWPFRMLHEVISTVIIPSVGLQGKNNHQSNQHTASWVLDGVATSLTDPRCPLFTIIRVE